MPTQLNSFIGRVREIGDIKTLLGKESLVTLTGVGGTGKTRLSLQVGAAMVDDYVDGVWFVELAPLSDERLVPQAVASVLGVKEEAGRPVQEALEKYVKQRHLLLILDNCEYLVHACALLAKQLLQAAPRLKVLASSREHLRVAGEMTYPVPALALPDAHPTKGETLSLEALMQFEALRLFIDRAVAAKPAFQVTDANAAAVSDICCRLDGIPLAIELAAARVRTLAVEKIATRLNDCFRLLTGGDHTVLPRHQTLRASIDWSYDLLSQPEQTLFRLLAVFAGGWTLEAAEAVGAGDGLDEAEVLDVLTQLVEKSLVAMQEDGTRYRLLETMRQYAQDRLIESGEQDQVRTRHLAYYLALAEKARPELFGPKQGEWLAQLDLERENLLVTHKSCDDAEGGGPLGLRLVFAVKPYWLNRGLPGLGFRVTVEALTRAQAQGRSLARCRALHNAGQLGSFMGRYAEAQSYLEESLAIAREIKDNGWIAAALQPLGMAYYGQGDLTAARKQFVEALRLAQKLGDKREFAAALNAVAQLNRVEGDLDKAGSLYEQVVELARELGDRESIAIGLLNLAMVLIGRGSADRAAEMLLEVLTIIDKIGSKPVEQSLLEVCAGLAAQRGEWERAAQLFGTVEAQMQHTGLQRDPSDEAFLAPLIAKTKAALGTAIFSAAEAAGRMLTFVEARAEVRTWLEEPG